MQQNSTGTGGDRDRVPILGYVLAPFACTETGAAIVLVAGVIYLAVRWIVRRQRVPCDVGVTAHD